MTTLASKITSLAAAARSPDVRRGLLCCAAALAGTLSSVLAPAPAAAESFYNCEAYYAYCRQQCYGIACQHCDINYYQCWRSAGGNVRSPKSMSVRKAK